MELDKSQHTPNTPLVHSTIPQSDAIGDNAEESRMRDIRLYDADATLEMSPEVARGFVILLTGGKHGGVAAQEEASSNNNSRSIWRRGQKGGRSGALTSQGENTELTAGMSAEALEIAFTALTYGNVIDAVFGVSTAGGLRRSRSTSRRAFEAARIAKDALRDAAEASDANRKLAVESFAAGFLAVMDHHAQNRKLNFISRCWKRRALRKRAEQRLAHSFRAIHDALAN